MHLKYLCWSIFTVRTQSLKRKLYVKCIHFSSFVKVIITWIYRQPDRLNRYVWSRNRQDETVVYSSNRSLLLICITNCVAIESKCSKLNAIMCIIYRIDSISDNTTNAHISRNMHPLWITMMNSDMELIVLKFVVRDIASHGHALTVRICICNINKWSYTSLGSLLCPLVHTAADKRRQ